MAIDKITAGTTALDPAASTGAQVATAVNKLIDTTTGVEPVDKITLKGLPNTPGAPAGYGDLASAVAGNSSFLYDVDQRAAVNSVGASSFKALFTKNSFLSGFSPAAVTDVMSGTYERSPLSNALVLVSRARFNRITNPTFSGAVVGLKGAGGALPTGWDLSAPQTGWEVVSISGGRLRLRLFRDGGAAFTSCSFRFSHTVGAISRSGLAWYPNAGVVSQSGAVSLLRLLFINSTKGTQITQLPITTLGEYGGYLACTAGDSISCRVDVGLNDGTSAFDITFDVLMPMLEEVNNLEDKTFYTPSQTLVGTSASIIPDSYLNQNTVVSIGNDVLFSSANALSNPARGAYVIPSIFKTIGELSSANKQSIADYIMGDIVFNQFFTPSVGTYARYGYTWTTQGNSAAASYAAKLAVNRKDVQRFEIREGDRRAGDSASINRLETFPSAGLTISDGIPLWSSFSFMIEDGPAIVDWFLINQIHEDSSKSPPFELQIIDDEIVIDKRSLDSLFPSSGNGIPVILHNAGKVQRGRWYNVVYKVTMGASGGVEFWLDGVKVVEFSGRIGYGLATYTYKYGIYRSASVTTQSVRFANIEVGLTSLIARVDNPLIA